LERPYGSEIPLSFVDNLKSKLVELNPAYYWVSLLPKYGELPIGRLIDFLDHSTERPFKSHDKALDAVDLFPTFPSNLMCLRLALSGIHYNGNHSSEKIAG
jgi:hypothetical protein